MEGRQQPVPYLRRVAAGRRERAREACNAGGMRVIVTGPTQAAPAMRPEEGENRTVYELEVDEVGPSLRSASAKVHEGGPRPGPADVPEAADPQVDHSFISIVHSIVRLLDIDE